jgi:hypothetical protein
VGLPKREVEIRGVVDGKGTGAQVKGIIRVVKRLVEIEKYKLNIRAAFLVPGAGFIEKFFREIAARDFCLTFSIIIEQKRKFARTAPDIENVHARPGLEKLVCPHVNVGRAIFFMNVDAGE